LVASAADVVLGLALVALELAVVELAQALVLKKLLQFVPEFLPAKLQTQLLHLG
jgi:hypothetical protein